MTGVLQILGRAKTVCEQKTRSYSLAVSSGRVTTFCTGIWICMDDPKDRGLRDTYKHDLERLVETVSPHRVLSCLRMLRTKTGLLQLRW